MKWTNLPYLVNVKTNLLFRGEKANSEEEPDVFMVWDKNTNQVKPLVYPWDDNLNPALEGSFEIDGELYKRVFNY